MPGRILLVEDDVPLREELCDLLEHEGHEVVGVGDGWEALSYLRTGHDCGLVVLDMGLPGMSGWELLARMRGQDSFRETPVIILSGSPITPASRRAPVFHKPLGEPARFLAAVRQHCRER